ncbi:glutathione synthase [Peziza echinospora]|nr:glutathione synthase [Peziza echinospora]
MASYPPALTQGQSDFLLASFTDWSLSHGLAVRPPASFVAENPNNALASHAPVSLFPSPFPRAAFEEARSLQTAYNALYAAIASDEEWLAPIIDDIASVDDFIGQLWAVYKEVKAVGFVQKLSLGLFRSDYMVHVDPTNPSTEPVVHQVEFNTIASSFGGLATRVSELHRHLYKIGAYGDDTIVNQDALPDNPALTALADGLAEAHVAYGSAKSPSALKTAIIFLVQEGERNAFDQRLLEYSLLENHNIQTHRVTFTEIPNLTTIDPTTRSLLYRPAHLPASSPPIEISTVYFRSGYGPGDYTSQTHWNTRKHLEFSNAIKCPTILTQLAGSKKIQQVLAQPGTLERFLPTDTQDEKLLIARIRNTFAGIFPLDAATPEGIRARSLALTCPENFVLKPQREGGGNNIYKAKIPGFLKSIPEDAWSGYILMELIHTPEGIENVIARNGQVRRGEVVGELGVYGTVLWEEEGVVGGGKGGVKVRGNRQAGWLLRTKGRESEEGGVAAGFGCVDSVVLV